MPSISSTVVQEADQHQRAHTSGAVFCAAATHCSATITPLAPLCQNDQSVDTAAPEPVDPGCHACDDSGRVPASVHDL